jgi:hypothetical protein
MLIVYAKVLEGNFVSKHQENHMNTRQQGFQCPKNYDDKNQDEI